MAFVSEPIVDDPPTDGRNFVLRRASFISRQNLKARIEEFIAYFNDTMAKPSSWTMTGKPLTA